MKQNNLDNYLNLFVEPEEKDFDKKLEDYIEVFYNYYNKTSKSKIFFQMAFGIFIPLLMILLTICLIVLMYFLFVSELDYAETITICISSITGYVVSIVSLFKIIVNYIFNKNDLKDSNKILNNIIKHKERDKVIDDNISQILNSINLKDSEENNIKK